MRASDLLLIAIACVGSASMMSAQVAGTTRLIDGSELSGTLTVSDGGSVTIKHVDGETRLGLDELVSFQRDDAELRNRKANHRIWLRSGGELPATKISGRIATETEPAILIAQLPSGIKIELPISTLRAIRQGGLMRPQPHSFTDDLAQPPENDDLIYVISDGKAHRSQVIITSLSSDSINFELRGEKTFGLDGVAAVVFGANTGFAPDRQPRPRTIVALTTGERIEGKLMRVAESVCLRLDEGVEVEVPANKLLGLEVVSDKLLWMSELTPEVAQTPAFDRVWPWYVDRSQAGPGFKLAKRHYDRGLGMVPYTRLTYALAGRFDLFEATIGIDDRGGPEAHAIFRVFVDGKKAFTSEAMTRGQTPQVIRIVLNRAQSMALEVDFGKNFDLGDYCVFADARVTQQ